MFSATVFFVQLFSSIFLATLVFLLLKVGLLHNDSFPKNPLTIIMVMMILSTITGTVISFIVSRVPLNPINELISATKELARGNFDTRIHLRGPNEFKELTESFNRMAEELGSIEMLRSDFVNNFSHEFKTPIVSMRGFAKVLKNSRHLTEDERNEYLDIIISESDRLSMLATNVLNLSKVEHQKIISENKMFDMSEQVRRAILLLEPKWSKKGLDLIIDLDEVNFYGNEDLLNQIWINLIDNAIKFSPQGAKIQLDLIEFNNEIIFKVKDNGYGIQPESQKYIFDKFYQCDKSHSTEGNGLGLTLVKKIVDMHNGQILVESNFNSGAVFTVKLFKKIQSDFA
jgi:signal transduction histidine kinase